MLKKERIIVRMEVVQMEGDIDLKSKFSCNSDFIPMFKEEWVKVTNLLKQYIKEERKNEE